MLKPDRFKILVDSNGHSAGDEAMMKIALILKNITRNTEHCWPLRFKSNEVGLIINNCDAVQALQISESLMQQINAMEPVSLKNPHTADSPQDEKQMFNFTATISWVIWPKDDDDWDNLFQGNYANLLDNWKSGGERIIHYLKNGIKNE